MVTIIHFIGGEPIQIDFGFDLVDVEQSITVEEPSEEIKVKRS